MDWREDLKEFLTVCKGDTSFTSYDEYKKSQIRKFEIESEMIAIADVTYLGGVTLH